MRSLTITLAMEEETVQQSRKKRLILWLPPSPHCLRRLFVDEEGAGADDDEPSDVFLAVAEVR